MSATTGRLLVAEPMLGDPNFDRTVVLILEHTVDGAMGLVLNRPTDVAVASALPEWAQVVSDPPLVHVGGPVEGESGWCLARVPAAEAIEDFAPVLGDVGLIGLDCDPAEVAGRVVAARLYAGYSGWGPGQLEHELAQDAWFVVDAEPGDPFLPDSATLWRRILARQPGPISRLATFPLDPNLN